MTAIEMPEKNDIIFAYKAIATHPDFGNSDIKVGVTIIDHFNRRTGQCDPSLGRLAELIGFNEKSVRRSVKKMVEHGFLKYETNGGGNVRNSYRPIWKAFRSYAGRWDERMKIRTPYLKDNPLYVADLKPNRDADVHSKGTPMSTPHGHRCPPNLSNKPIEENLSNSDCARDEAKTAKTAGYEDNKHNTQHLGIKRSKSQADADHSVQQEHQKEAVRKEARTNHQGYIVHTISGGRRTVGKVIAEDAPDKRVSLLMRSHEGLWLVDGLGDSVAAAERQEKWSGREIIDDYLKTGLVASKQLAAAND